MHRHTKHNFKYTQTYAHTQITSLQMSDHILDPLDTIHVHIFIQVFSRLAFWYAAAIVMTQWKVFKNSTAAVDKI